jgi:hypothetical protein
MCTKSKKYSSCLEVPESYLERPVVIELNNGSTKFLPPHSITHKTNQSDPLSPGNPKTRHRKSTGTKSQNYSSFPEVPECYLDSNDVIAVNTANTKLQIPQLSTRKTKLSNPPTSINPKTRYRKSMTTKSQKYSSCALKPVNNLDGPATINPQKHAPPGQQPDRSRTRKLTCYCLVILLLYGSIGHSASTNRPRVTTKLTKSKGKNIRNKILHDLGTPKNTFIRASARKRHKHGRTTKNRAARALRECTTTTTTARNSTHQNQQDPTELYATEHKEPQLHHPLVTHRTHSRWPARGVHIIINTTQLTALGNTPNNDTPNTNGTAILTPWHPEWHMLQQLHRRATRHFASKGYDVRWGKTSHKPHQTARQHMQTQTQRGRNKYPTQLRSLQQTEVNTYTKNTQTTPQHLTTQPEPPTLPHIPPHLRNHRRTQLTRTHPRRGPRHHQKPRPNSHKLQDKHLTQTQGLKQPNQTSRSSKYKKFYQ